MTEFFDRGMKAKDQASLEAALTTAGLLPTPAGVAYYFIGAVITKPAVLDDTGIVTMPPVETADVHANIRLFGGDQATLETALLAAFPDTATPMTDDGSLASYVMDLRIPITCIWA